MRSFHAVNRPGLVWEFANKNKQVLYCFSFFY
jgi:hypothetical protein